MKQLLSGILVVTAVLATSSGITQATANSYGNVQGTVTVAQSQPAYDHIQFKMAAGADYTDTTKLDVTLNETNGYHYSKDIYVKNTSGKPLHTDADYKLKVDLTGDVSAASNITATIIEQNSATGMYDSVYTGPLTGINSSNSTITVSTAGNIFNFELKGVDGSATIGYTLSVGQ